MCDVLDKVESRGIEKGIAKGIEKAFAPWLYPRQGAFSVRPFSFDFQQNAQ